MSRLRCFAILAGCLVVVANVELSAAPPELAPAPQLVEPVRFDPLGDALPAGAFVRLGSIRARHGTGVTHVAIAPDGKTCISGDQLGMVSIWEAGSGRESRRFLGHFRFKDTPTRIHALALSPDGKTLAVGGDGGALHLWEAATGRPAGQINGVNAYAIAFASDGKTVVGAGRESDQLNKAERYLAWVWDLHNKKQLLDVVCTQHAQGVALSPDGKLLACWGFKFEKGMTTALLTVWEVATAKEVHQISGQRSAYCAAAFSPDSKVIAWAGGDKTIRLVDLASGKELGQLNGHATPVTHLRCAPDGKTLVSGSFEGNVHRWDLATLKETSRHPAPRNQAAAAAPRRLSSLMFLENGSLFASGHELHGVQLWDVADSKLLLPVGGHQMPIAGIGRSPDQQTFVTTAGDGTVCTWNASTGQGIREFNLISPFKAVPSPDGMYIATSDTMTVRLWDTATGKEIRRFRGHEKLVYSLAFSPDGQLLATGGADQMVRVWQVGTGRSLGEFRSPDAGLYFNPVAFAPDGKSLAAAWCYQDAQRALSYKLYHWRVDDADKPTWTLPWNNVQIFAMTFSPDGQILAVGGQDPELLLRKSLKGPGPLYLVDVATGKALPKLPSPGGTVMCLDFSPDGKTLAFGTTLSALDYRVQLWEVASGISRRQLAGHRGWIRSLAFAPDGLTLTSGSTDCTALSWDVTGRLVNGRLRPASLHAEEVEALWKDLAGADGGRCYDAIWKLASAPKETVPFLEKHLDHQRIRQLITDLNSDSFDRRQQASRELEQLGTTPFPLLAEALANKPALEMQRRLEKLLEKPKGQSQPHLELRPLRALEALERMQAPEARRLLRALAESKPETRLSREAKSALERLAK